MVIQRTRNRRTTSEEVNNTSNWETNRQEILKTYTTFLSENGVPVPESNMDSTEHDVVPNTQDAELDLPISLRRRKRRCSSLAGNTETSPEPTMSTASSSSSSTSAPTIAASDSSNSDIVSATPSRTRRKKRVRFSEPGPGTARQGTPSLSTGLTPYVQRTSISTPTTTTNRRHSAPFTLMGTPHPFVLSDFDHDALVNGAREIQFTPIRQVLDERCKRRIRRHGLSEEINNMEADKKEKERLKKQIEEKDDLLKKMKEELEKRNEPEKQNAEGIEEHVLVPATTTQSVVDEVEEELRALRRSMQDIIDADDIQMVPNSLNEAAQDTQMRDAATQPAAGGAAATTNDDDDSDTILIYEDDDARTEPFGSDSIYRQYLPGFNTRDAATNADLPDLRQDAELLTMALDLEVAKQEKREIFKEWRSHFQRGLASTGLNFCDTPTRNAATSSNSLTRSLPSPPPNFLQQLSSNLKSMTKRAEDAELALCALETELKGLGFTGKDGEDIIAEIKRQFRSARMELERTVPGETTFGLNGNGNLLPEVLLKMKKLVKQVRERQAEFRMLNEQHRTLKGNFDHALISMEQATKKIRDLEDTIEVNAEDMLEARMRAQELEREEKEKDETVKCLTQALDRYREDVSKMEKLIMEMEAEEPFKIHAAQEEMQNELNQITTELTTKVAAEEEARRNAEVLASQRLARVEELQTALDIATKHAMEVHLQMNNVQAEKEEEEFKLKKKLHESSEQHQVQVGTLNTKISNLTTALASAETDAEKLKSAKERLELRLRIEIEQGERIVEAMQNELIRTVAKVNENRKSYIRGTKIRYANSEMEEEERESSPASSSAPMTPVSLVRFADVEVGRGKKRSGGAGRGMRRRYDSGIGLMSDEIEEEVEEEGNPDQEVGIVGSEDGADIEMF